MPNDDTDDHDEDKTVLVQEKSIRTKGKCKSHLRPKDIFLDLKQKSRRGKCLGAGSVDYAFPALLMDQAKAEEQPTIYNIIGSEIWYFIAEHIPPEAVCTFALICRQTADLINTRKFWSHLYQRYCKPTLTDSKRALSLPKDLQADNIRFCDKGTLRARVIESLFYCYSPLVERAKRGYSLDNLVGHTYLASWHEQQHCVWIMCYKFCNKIAMCRRRQFDEEQVPTLDAEDWETLADDKMWRQPSATTIMHPQEGVTLLVICCDRFLPFPNQLLYDCAESRAKLHATRQLLAKDMCGSNLELDFIDASSKAITTVKYPKILSCKALPWWHPDFRKFIK